MNRVLGCCFCSSVRCGILTRQGPHQVAQNSTTYRFPFSRLRTGVPFTNSFTVIAGAGSPIPNGCAPALAAAQNKSIPPPISLCLHIVILFSCCEAAFHIQ